MILIKENTKNVRKNKDITDRWRGNKHTTMFCKQKKKKCSEEKTNKNAQILRLMSDERLRKAEIWEASLEHIVNIWSVKTSVQKPLR